MVELHPDNGESPLTSTSDGAGAMNRVIDIECRASEKVITDGMRIANTLKKHYGYAGQMFVEALEKQSMETVAALYQEIFQELSASDTTEKQAMAAAMILVADVLATRWIFMDGQMLTMPEISAFLQSKAAVSSGERGYRYMCDWVAQNVNKFSQIMDTGDVYGVIENDVAYIINSVFRRAAEDGGFSSSALISYLKQQNLIMTRSKNNTRGKRIRGVLIECIALRLASEESDTEIDFVEI